MKPRFTAAKILALAAMLALLGACAAGPKYVRPSVATPAAYKEAGDWKVAQPQDTVKRGKWWEIFRDAQLDALAGQIDISNQNVRIAEARFRQARALVQSARAGLFPGVTGGGSVTRSGSPSGATRSSGPATTYDVSIDAGWEVDLWGRVRNTVESNVASAEASASDLEAVRLSAQAELALDYFQLRVLDGQRQLLQNSVAAFQKSLDLTRNRYAAGVAGKVDVVQAETQLKSTQAQAIDIGVQRAQLEHAIAILIGRPPAEFALAPIPLNLAMPAIPLSLPSELLERRPDIAAAERRVAAANAQVGVAKSAFFPALTLSASAGFQSSSFAQWLTLPSRFWAVGPAIAQSIFDAGLRRALTAQAIAVYDANVAAYRQTVLSGFQEVEDNLAALHTLEQEARVQADAVEASRQAVELTLNQYKAGTVNYLNVVAVQTAQLTNERTATSILGRRLTAAVTLVKALGGGWSTAELPIPEQPR
ncbi:MAG: efflux transporter outer membrane subunit [Betaproteobacteria bacterium]|nr:efflux transporter outer membrane subunit [Betaproteobacteria bacterium]